MPLTSPDFVGVTLYVPPFIRLLNRYSPALLVVFETEEAPVALTSTPGTNVVVGLVPYLTIPEILLLASVTVKVAEAVPPLPPFVEVTLPVVLTLAPVVVALTLTVKVQAVLTGMVAPLMETLVAPATGAKVPVEQLFVAAGVASTTISAGKGSVTPTPVKATVLAAGFVIVMVKVETPLTTMVVGEKLLEIVGGEATVKVNCLVVGAEQLSVKVTVTVYVPAGAASAIVTTPVVESTVSVPAKPVAVAVAVVIEPLSAGAEVGVTVVPPPGFKFVFA
jgi:hypothetical protein